MRFSYFKTLSLPWQARIICELGVRLGERQYKDVFVELYQVNSFYVEVHYRQSDSEIMKITSFEDMCYLEPYFNTISLTDLSPSIIKEEN